MKKIMLPVFAVVLAIGGWFFHNSGGIKYISGDLQKLDEIPAQITDVKRQGLAPNSYINAFVVKVSDGDTLEVSYNGTFYKVRLLYVDTPESVKAGVPVQEYAREASELTKSIVLNQPVKLVFEKDLRDRYGRLLAHIILKDGTYLNGLLVRNGFARVEVVKPNDSLAVYFYGLQDKAVKEKRGLWGLPADKQPFVKDGQGLYVPKYWTDEIAS